MGYFVRSIGALAALAIVCTVGLSSRSATAAPVTFSNTVTITNPPLSSPGHPVELNFAFSAPLINVQSITIYGTFGAAGNDAWNYLEKFAFSTGPTGPYGASYYHNDGSGSGIMQTFLLSLYPAPTGSQPTTPDVFAQYPSSGTTAFKEAMLTQLASTGTLTLYFQPQLQHIYQAPSQFRLYNATLTAVGDDPPLPVAHMPIPAGGLLFVSGAAIIWLSTRRRHPR